MKIGKSTSDNSKSSSTQDKQDKYGLNKGDKYGLKENKYKKFGADKANKYNKSEKSETEKEARAKSPFNKLLNKNSANAKPMAPMASFVPKKKSVSLQWFFTPNNLISSFFGIGYIKYAPGTFASLIAFPLYFGIKNQILPNLALSKELVLVFWGGLVFLLFIIGGYFANIYSNKIGEEDPKQIVIDEIVGQIATIAIASYSKISDPNLNLLLCFILFRFFDITKPLFIGLADERIGGGYGTMFDDLLAAICAGGIILLIGIIPF